MRRVIPLLAVLTFAFAPLPLPKPVKKTDRGMLCGTWELASQTCGGVPQQRELKWVFTERASELTADHATSPWEVDLDQKKYPKTIDFRVVMPGRAPPPFRGVYALDGDDFKVCYDALDRTARPKDLSGRGASEVLWVFKRMKP